jgi:hypothetical protein
MTFDSILTAIGMFIGSTGLGGIVTYFLTKKKYNTEVKAGDLQNETVVVQIWKELVMELEGRVNMMDDELNKLRIEVLNLHQENIQLKRENMNLKDEIEKLKNK